MKSKGFSLIEMIIVVAIILILTAIGILHYMAAQANNAITVSVQMVASDLKLAKDIASTSSSGAEIDLGPLTGQVTPIVIKQSGSVVRTDNLPPEVTISTSWGSSGESSVIVFEQNGTTSSFGSNTTNGVITIARPGISRTEQITVDPYTGGILK